MSKKIETGDNVTISTVGKLANGMVFTDTSEDGPLKFKVGNFDVIQGLNDAVIGMSKGEEKTIFVEAKDGFGEYDENFLADLPIDKLPENAEAGMQLSSESPEGEEVIWTIKEIKDDVAVLDGNHILAGQRLEFKIKIDEVE